MFFPRWYEKKQGLINLPEGHSLYKSAAALQELQQILQKASQQEAELERLYKDYVDKMERDFNELSYQARGEGGPESQTRMEQVTQNKERHLVQVKKRLQAKEETNAQYKQHELTEWQNRYPDIIPTLAEARDAVFVTGQGRDPVLKDIEKLKIFMREKGLIPSHRISYSDASRELVKKTEAWLQGHKQFDGSELLKEKAGEAVRLIKEVEKKRYQALEQAEKSLANAEPLRSKERRTRRDSKQLQKLQKEYAQEMAKAQQHEQTLLDLHSRLNLFQEYQEIGVRISIKSPQLGENDPRVKKLRERAAQSLCPTEKEPGDVTIKNSESPYYGLALDEVPVEHLIWIANGSELIRKIKSYRTKNGLKRPLPVEQTFYEQARYSQGQLPRFVKAYLQSPAGKRRLAEYYHNATSEYQKVLIGAAPEFEELSRRAEETRQAAKPKTPGQREKEVIKAYKQLQASKELFNRQQRVRNQVYYPVYHQEIEAGLLDLHLTQEDLQKMKKFNVMSAEVKEVIQQAKRKAEKAYEKALKAHQLDDYSLFYRQYLKAGFGPDEADKMARRDQDVVSKGWRTPAIYQGRGQTKREREELKQQEEEILDDFLKRYIAMGGAGVTFWERARLDPNWRPTNAQKWMRMETSGAWNFARRLAEEVSRLGELGSAPNEQMDKLESIWQTVVRLYFGGMEGGHMLPLHPFIKWLVNRIDEKRVRLELMEKNLHASGQTVSTLPGEIGEIEDEEDYTPGFEEETSESLLLDEQQGEIAKQQTLTQERGTYEADTPLGPRTFPEVESTPGDTQHYQYPTFSGWMYEGGMREVFLDVPEGTDVSNMDLLYHELERTPTPDEPLSFYSSGWETPRAQESEEKEMDVNPRKYRGQGRSLI